MSRRDGGAYRRAGLTVALALAALAALPAIASAATVSSALGTITYQAVPGETNSVVVDDPGSTYTFAETPITAGPGCTQTNANLVTCSDSGVNIVVMNMNDMGDTVNASGANQDPFTVNGEGGDDTLTLSVLNDTGNGGVGADIIDGREGNDIINGDADNDNLYGGISGTDDLNGGDGNDRMDGGQGSSNDDYDGGAGIDRVVYGSLDPPGTPNFSYTCTDQSVIVTIGAGNTDDRSCANEDRDDENVQGTVESITGSTINDTITGSCFANTFAGDPGSANGSSGGADTLNGDPASGCAPNGTDFMGGGEGNDVFDGDGSGTAAFDTVTYGFPYTGAATGTCSGQAVTTGFAVNLDTDNAADDCDGFGNTAENVHSDIERIIGSGAADRINATAAAQGVNLFGRLGGDTLIGSAFGDFLDGEGGVDSLTCLGGLDTYRDNENEDTVAADCEAEV